jgi:hypothetical protein
MHGAHGGDKIDASWCARAGKARQSRAFRLHENGAA